MGVEDWPAVARIFEQGIAGGNATFERSAPSWEQWSKARCPEPRLIARDESGVIGWAALTPASARRVYRGVGAVSIYVDAAVARRGVGRALLKELVRASECAGFWALKNCSVRCPTAVGVTSCSTSIAAKWSAAPELVLVVGIVALKIGMPRARGALRIWWVADGACLDLQVDVDAARRTVGGDA
jgi:GNAT superfamily N-acetyltransferase